MKPTKELEEKLNNAKSPEETKAILTKTKESVEDAGVILADAELDQVAGGLVDGMDGVSMSESFREYINS